MQAYAGVTLDGAISRRIENRAVAIVRVAVLVFGVALATAAAAQIKVPTVPVPVTLQTLAVLASGMIFGKKIGVLGQLTYLFGGLAGVPWFSAGGGLAYLLSPTFGYVIGFVAAAYLVGLLAENGADKNFFTAAAAMLLGNAAIYLFGVSWLAMFVPPANAVAWGLYPFLAADALKISAAGLSLPAILKLIKKKNR